MFNVRFSAITALTIALFLSFSLSGAAVAQVPPAAKPKPARVAPLAPPKPKASPTGQAPSQAQAAKPAPAPSSAPPQEPVKLDPEFTLYMDLEYGRVVIRMRPDLAPVHVARVKELVRQGFYDGLVFHRVIDGFMAQTGDPTGTGSGGSDKPDLKAEFSAEPHKRGTVSAARTGNPNSANSQFFICFERAPWLDKQYSVWGKVTEGMENVDKIKRGEPVQNPDQIVKARMALDA